MAKPRSQITYKAQKKLPVIPLILVAVVTVICVYIVVDSFRGRVVQEPQTLPLPAPSNTSVTVSPQAPKPEPSIFEKLTGNTSGSPYEQALNSAITRYQNGDINAAITQLSGLAAQHPTRPEALNNLAVIYADQGEQQQAIDTLQKALNTDPAYAKVYQNLSDIYAALAAEAYNKALGIDTKNGGIQLAMINTAPAKAPITTVATVAPAPENVAVIEAKPKPNTTSSTVTKPLVIDGQLSEPPAPVTQADTNAEKTLPLARVESPDSGYTNKLLSPSDTETIIAAQSSQVITDPNKPTPEELAIKAEEEAIAQETERASQLLREISASVSTDESSTPATQDVSPTLPAIQKQVPPPSVDPEDQVRMLVNRWAAAWSEQNVDGYINSYVDNYTPSANTSHSTWTSLRRSRLTRPQFIRVRLNEMTIEVLSDKRAIAVFTQHYTADHYSDVETKRLELVSTENGWKIETEGTL
ncbi:MAG: L,D-transpeptidase Cds6 family protein [Pontibacterium sp.]